MLERRQMGNPLYVPRHDPTIGFDGQFGNNLNLIRKYHPFEHLTGFVCDSDFVSNKTRWINIQGKQAYGSNLSCLVENGASLDQWDIFSTWKYRNDQKSLHLIEKGGKRHLSIPIQNNHYLVTAQETEGRVLAYLTDNIGFYCLHIYPDGKVWVSMGEEPPLNQHTPQQLEEEQIAGVNRGAVYQDWCICILNGTFIFPKQHFNYAFLTRISSFLKSKRYMRTTPNFFWIPV